MDLLFLAPAIGIILLSWIYFHFKEKYNYWKKLGVKSLKAGFPFGSLSENASGKKAMATIIDDHYHTFKNERYFGMYQFTEPVLVVKDLDLIKQITGRDFDHFTDHQLCANDDVDKFWSKTLFAMMGDTWRKMRSTLSPAFTGNKMRYMFPLVNNIAENLIKSLMKNKGLIKLEMKDTFSKLTNDTIASCAFGINCDSINDPGNAFYRIGKKGIDFVGVKRMKFLLYSSFPKIMKFFGVKIFVKEFKDFFRDAINKTIKQREEEGLVRHDIIHVLLKARKGEVGLEEENEDSTETFKEYLSNEYIAAQAAIFYFGGYDTTAYFMSFLAYNLATHPEVQEKLRHEIESALQESDGEISYELIHSIKYLDLVINETLRLYAPIVNLERICTKEYTIQPTSSAEKPLVIRKGMNVWIPTYSIQRDEIYYDNPDQFDPERSIGSRSPLLGFGLGPRACIGQRFALMENRAVICHLLRSFELVTIDETQIPIKLSTVHVPITSEGGIWLGLKCRKL